MAINKAVRAALKALSYPDPDVEATYKVERQVKTLAGRLRAVSPFYQIWDREIRCGDHAVPVRIFAPPDTSPHPVLLFFHGGGWVVGNIDSYTGVCLDMVRQTGQIVVSVDYRLAPEFPFPAGLEDCYAVLQEICRNGGPLGSRMCDLTVIGDSAGGNLAAAVSLLSRDRGEFLPPRQILLYPATYCDHTPDSPFASVVENGTDYLLTSKRVEEFMTLYQSDPSDRQSPYFAPLLAKDFSHQPRTLVITAEFCPLRDEGEAFGERLWEAGNKVKIFRIKDALHGYFSLPARFPQVAHTYDLINRFLTEQM